MALTSKLSVDQLVERINNSSDIFESKDSFTTPGVETLKKKIDKKYVTGVLKRRFKKSPKMTDEKRLIQENAI